MSADRTKAGVDTAGVAAIVPDWPAPANVRALSTLRTGGVSTQNHASLNLGAHVGDRPEAVAENRRRLGVHFGLPHEPAWLCQVHGVGVANLDTTNSMGEADAAVTGMPDRICAILAADCLPVLFCDRGGTWVAAAHAGWRGLLAGILEATVRAMPVPAGQIMAWLGPAIGPASFEVGAEVREQFMARHACAADAFAANARGRFLADLYLLARQRLGSAGINSVYGGGECTFSDPARFFSHRREPPTGRQATLIWRTDPT